MNTLPEHYRLLLGLDEAWEVESVELDLEGKRVQIRLSHRGGTVICPDCGAGCPRHDLAPERTWRHLDTMQFETLLQVRVPRCQCSQCGVKTVATPWAGKHSRFTLLFEAFAIQVLLASSSIQQAALLLRLDWGTVQSIMRRSVERGLARRSVEEVQHVGMDEKNFGAGQSYVSLLTDLDGRRVLEVTEGRTRESADQLWQALPEEQREQVESVSVDMWPPYLQAAAEHAPAADVVHDKFHLAKELNEAVDQVRRQEHKSLQAEGDQTLKGSRQLWLFNQANLDRTRQREFRQLQQLNLRTSRAWAIKEQFSAIWWYSGPGWAKRFFGQWYSWAIRSRLRPVERVARTFKRHLPGILNYFRHFVTNATSEGFNSRIQALKHAARGFRRFDHYRIRILFFCGKLNLLPGPTH